MFLTLTILVGGCTTVAPADADPLEDRTEVLFGQVEFELQLTDIVVLNPYLEKDSPRVDEFDAARLELVEAAEFLVDFSVDAINASRDASDRETVAIVVQLLEELYSNLQELPFITNRLADIDVDTILADAAGQKNLPIALRVAAPVTREIAQALTRSVDDANGLFDLALSETYDKIVDEHRAFINYADNLVVRRNELLEKMLLLDQARQGDATAWQDLLEQDAELSQELGSAAALTSASVVRAETILVDRLEGIMEVWGYLEPSWTGYQEALRELYAVDNNVRGILRVAKFIIEDWEEAQREMARGRPAAFLRVTQDLAYLALRRAARR